MKRVINFMGIRHLAFAATVLLTLVSLGSLAFQGLNFGLDFTGGTLIELGAGNCQKARTLCRLVQPACFVGVDISADFLEQAVQGLRPGFLDCRFQIADGFGAKAFQLANSFIVKPVDLGYGAQQAQLVELPDVGIAQPADVHRVLGGEMHEALQHLG